MNSLHLICVVPISTTFSILILFSVFLSACECAPINNKQTITVIQSNCTSSSDCSEGENCFDTSQLGYFQCTGSSSHCVCDMDITCSANKACDDDSVCINMVGMGLCTTCEAYEQVTSDGMTQIPIFGKNTCGGVCVDANLLSHIDQQELIFSTHRRASVLCDAHGSCATSGHIVVYKEKSMMMCSYCEMDGNCSRKVMSVNSPKMGLNVRVPTKTEGLEFTALAAKHGSIAEEVLLSALIKIGF